MKAIKHEGIISLIGILGGAQAKDNLVDVLVNICTVRGVYVGSRQQMEDMVAAIEANDIKPVVDETVFTLDKVREAYEYMVSFPYLLPTYLSTYLPSNGDGLD